MQKYYAIDFKKKVHAAKILQRMVRKYMERVWRFDREFHNRDTEMLVQRRKALLSQRHSLVEDVGMTDPSRVLSSDLRVIKEDPYLHRQEFMSRNKRSLSSSNLLEGVDAHSLTYAEGKTSYTLAQVHAKKMAEESGDLDALPAVERRALEEGKHNQEDFFITRGNDGKPKHVVQISHVEVDILNEVHAAQLPKHAARSVTNNIQRSIDAHAPHKALELSSPSSSQISRRETSMGLRDSLRAPPDLVFFKKKQQSNTATHSGANGGGDAAECMSQDKILRPTTAPETCLPTKEALKADTKRQRDLEKKRLLEVTKAKLGLSDTNKVGLPAEVFEDFLEPVSMSTGIKFLRTQVRLAGDYSDVRMKKKKRPTTAGAVGVSHSASFVSGTFASAIHNAPTATATATDGMHGMNYGSMSGPGVRSKQRPGSTNSLRSSTSALPANTHRVQQQQQQQLQSPHPRPGSSYANSRGKR